MPRPSVEAERRDQILRAACEVVSESGFKSLRIADVAERVEMSTGTVHYYFTTKRDLVRAAFEWNFLRSQERRAPLLEQQDDPRLRLRALVESYLPGTSTTQSWRVWVELWAEALHDPDLRDLNERVYGEWRQTVAGIVQDGQAAGQFRQGDPVLLANGVVGMIDGLSLQVLLGSRSMTVDRMRAVCDQVIELLDEPARGI